MNSRENQFTLLTSGRRRKRRKQKGKKREKKKRRKVEKKRRNLNPHQVIQHLVKHCPAQSEVKQVHLEVN